MSSSAFRPAFTKPSPRALASLPGSDDASSAGQAKAPRVWFCKNKEIAIVSAFPLSAYRINKPRYDTYLVLVKQYLNHKSRKGANDLLSPKTAQYGQGQAYINCLLIRSGNLARVSL